MNMVFRVFSVCMLLLVVVEPAFAATGSEPWDGPLQSVIDILTGPTGRLIAAVVVASIGVGALFGKFSWLIAGQVIGGIILIFGSVTIANFFIDAVA